MTSNRTGESLLIQPKAINRFESSGSAVRRTPLLPIVVITTALLLTVFEGAVRKWFLGGIMGPASYAMYLSKDFVFALLLLARPRYVADGSARFFQKYLIIGTVLIIAGAVL